MLRIDSDPNCDICLLTADVSPHALTLEFRAKNYRVYNRGTEPVTVGSAVVPSGGNAVWNEEESVVLAGMRLSLAIDGDPQPSPRPESRRDDELLIEDVGAPVAAASSPDDEAAAKKKSSKTMVQLAVIGFCGLAMAALLTMGGGEDTAAADLPTFDDLVVTTLAKEPNNPLRALLPKLQYAQAALVRNNLNGARRSFLKLREQLMEQVKSLPKEKRHDAQQMLDYVEYRLSQL